MYSLGVLVRQLLGDELRRREQEFGGLLSDLIGFFATRTHLQGRQAGALHGPAPPGLPARPHLRHQHRAALLAAARPAGGGGPAAAAR